jgi:hypothetical protein
MRFSTAATSSSVSTTGSRRGRGARTRSSSHGNGVFSTCLYRNRIAQSAWFCVEALRAQRQLLLPSGWGTLIVVEQLHLRRVAKLDRNADHEHEHRFAEHEVARFVGCAPMAFSRPACQHGRVQAVVVPDRLVEVGLVAKPDVVAIALGALVEGQGAGRAVAILESACEVLVGGVAAVAPGVELTAGRLRLGSGGGGDKASKHERADVQLDGVLYLPLAESLGFWQRAELVARVVETIGGAAQELGKRKPSVTLRWREPVARVRDIEAARALLSERYRAYARAMIDGVDGASLRVDWDDVLAEVIQVPVSLDEVRLMLVPAERARHVEPGR